ncbi:hypothetical protein TVAG_396310 [Trichomonas vaginalis G3]|uniref:RING-type domain-containing protein n=1 Tax=Trichomonas vaginalis (strain ATCC PRA-98 / G3) TaxID=412133 RepID=A2ESE1_TRIV3|nr:MDM2/MDM4 family protein binding [Trichomonas vaginalis G3]EAY04444.1 hypothetical protein TVAG_396310 [Trichomonas vaginalis G3]KAI5502194.1 MDM2/MDM4 family protein binding [Trichomonas vaginalis G3]|eukprot:XP_001316667.1 hypothetical protein [Trichomonas vaginalis G3]
MTEDEEENCMICMGPLATEGEHRVCSLKCGHIFGYKCIVEWLNTKSTCPACNSPATVESIIPLYWRGGKVIKNSELIMLTQENEKLKAENAEIIQSLSSNQTSQYSQASYFPSYPTILMTKEINDGLRLSFTKSRIVVTEKVNDNYGISYTEWQKPKWNFIPLCKLIIRDISVNKSPIEKSLTVSHEGSFSVVNLNENSIITTNTLPETPWCCCWINEDKAAIGAAHGTIFVVNTRTGDIISKKSTGPENPQFQSIIPTSTYSVIALNCRNAFTFNIETSMFIPNPISFDHEYIKMSNDNLIAISLKNKKCTLCDIKFQTLRSLRWFPIGEIKTRARPAIGTRNKSVYIAIPKPNFDFSIREIHDIDKDLYGSFSERYTTFEKNGSILDLDFSPGPDFLFAAMSSSLLIVLSLPVQ